MLDLIVSVPDHCLSFYLTSWFIDDSSMSQNKLRRLVNFLIYIKG